MSFLNATLLAGMIAASVPVVLHLLAKQQPKRVVFPGVAFLTPRLTQQQSHLQVRRWWLLALRILAVIAFALVLARPHIDVSLASSWITIGVVGLAAIGLIAMASVSFAQNRSRGLSWSLLGAAIFAFLIFAIGGLSTLASGKIPDLDIDRPAAVAILIDNSPSSAWAVGGAGSKKRLSVALTRANELLERLPSGSRIGIVDRSTAPVSFALDIAAARTRLNQVKSLAVVSPIADRIETAIELVRTSELPNRRVVVITDLTKPTWDVDVPNNVESSRISPARREGVQVSLLKLDGGDESNGFNRFLSLPKLANAAPTSDVALPITVNLGMQNLGAGNLGPRANPIPNDSASNGPADNRSQTATVQLLLYENDPSLPVVRDGQTVLPRLRTVDRASVTLNPKRINEVVLSLPPLPRGTYHAMMELVGEDRFAWDNRRYLTIHLPEPPRVLVVGDESDELSVIAAAMTAPHAVDAPSAPYRIETIGYRDLGAIEWDLFKLIVMIDPPVRFDSAQQSWVGSPDGLSTAMLEQLAEQVSRGSGVLFSLGPASQAVNTNRGSETTLGTSANNSPAVASLLPELVRKWRVPEPGTFWQVSFPPHPIFEPLSRPSTMPNWSDFRIRRYWQVKPDGWNVISRLAQDDSTGSRGQATWFPGAMTCDLGKGRIVVTTTPLPALGPVTRTWNDFFTSGDAWPAFVTVRTMSSWLTGIDRNPTTFLVGQTALLNVSTEIDSVNIERKNDTASQSVMGVDFTEPFEVTWRAYPSDGPPFEPKSSSISSSSSKDETTLSMSDLSTPGTYFLREFGTASQSSSITGVSANLPERWSSDERVDLAILEKWLGPNTNERSTDPSAGWSMTDDVSKITLEGNGSGAAVSLHGPLMLLAVLIFIGEQLLGNFFYGKGRSSGGSTTTQNPLASTNRLSAKAT